MFPQEQVGKVNGPGGPGRGTVTARASEWTRNVVAKQELPLMPAAAVNSEMTLLRAARACWLLRVDKFIYAAVLTLLDRQCFCRSPISPQSPGGMELLRAFQLISRRI